MGMTAEIEVTKAQSRYLTTRERTGEEHVTSFKLQERISETSRISPSVLMASVAERMVLVFPVQ